MFCNKFHAVTKRSQMDPNTTKCTKTLVLSRMGWIGSIRCEKTRRDFVARTSALIAPVHPVLHRVSCSYETIPKEHKYYETNQNMRFGSNGVDQVRSLRRIEPVQYVLQQVSCSYETIPNAPKYYKTDRK